MWECSDISIGGRGGNIYRWVLRAFPFGPVWLNYHDGCCDDAAVQRVWTLTVEGLGIRNDELPLAKSGEEAKAQALVKVRFKLDAIRAQLVDLETNPG